MRLHKELFEVVLNHPLMITDCLEFYNYRPHEGKQGASALNQIDNLRLEGERKQNIKLATS